MSGSSVIWLLDDREIRRAAISGFLANWAQQLALEICPVASVEALADQRAERTPPRAELCILVVGGTTLGDPNLRARVRGLVEYLDGRPLAILTDLDASEEVSLAVGLGVHGLLTTGMSQSLAIAAMNFILSGGAYFKGTSVIGIYDKGAIGPQPPLNSPPRMDEIPPRPRADQPALTQRQKEIVAMLKLGRSNKEIARMLEISDATVKIFVRQVMKKYGAINRTQVALLASDAMSQMDIVKPRPQSQVRPDA